MVDCNQCLRSQRKLQCFGVIHRLVSVLCAGDWENQRVLDQPAQGNLAGVSEYFSPIDLSNVITGWIFSNTWRLYWGRTPAEESARAVLRSILPRQHAARQGRIGDERDAQFRGRRPGRHWSLVGVSIRNIRPGSMPARSRVWQAGQTPGAFVQQNSCSHLPPNLAYLDGIRD